MQKKRLLKLAKLLVANSRKKTGPGFDFSNWGYQEEKGDPMDCGTKVCALGLAAVSGEFKRAGLAYSVTRHGSIKIRAPGTRNAVKAGAKVFGLTLKQSNWLFTEQMLTDYGWGPDAEREMAQVIRNFVKGSVGPPPRY